jgi:hypothetical protein
MRGIKRPEQVIKRNASFRSKLEEITEKVEENAYDKLSTDMNSEKVTDTLGRTEKEKDGETEQSTPKNSRKNVKFNHNLKPDQVKKDLANKSNLNVDWIKKRVSKGISETKNFKTNTKMYFNQSVYELDEDSKKGKKSTGEIKKVYKELKESFNLLYPADMGQKDTEKKPATSSLYTSSLKRDKPSYSQKPANSTRKEFHSSLHSPDKQVLINKCNHQLITDSKVGVLKSEPSVKNDPAFMSVRNLDRRGSYTLMKGSNIFKTNTDLPNSPSKQKVINLNINKQKSTTVRTNSHVESDPSGNNKSPTFVPTNSEKTISSFANPKTAKKASPLKQSVSNIKHLKSPEPRKLESAGAGNKQTSSSPDRKDAAHVPMIHRSFSNYYLKNFLKNSNSIFIVDVRIMNNCKAQTRDFDLKNESPNSDAELPLRKRSSEGSQSHPCSPTNHQGGTEKKMESFYSLVFSEKPAKKLTSTMKSFIEEMIKTIQDFGNRFPQGTPPPERTVNLPKRDPKSTQDVDSRETYSSIRSR